MQGDNLLYLLNPWPLAMVAIFRTHNNGGHTIAKTRTTSISYINHRRGHIRVIVVIELAPTERQRRYLDQDRVQEKGKDDYSLLQPLVKIRV